MTEARASGKFGRDTYLKREYEAYGRWKSLPNDLRGLSRHSPLLYSVRDDMELAGLMTIKNQRQFAEYYGIKDLGTLTDWNTRLEWEGHEVKQHLFVNRFRNKLMKEALAALYERIIRHGRGRDFKAFAYEVEAWIPTRSPKPLSRRVMRKLDKLIREQGVKA